MIIGLSGRIGSGKSVLSSICEKHGYKRLFFALPLKQMVAQLLRIPSIQKLDELKNVERDFWFMREDYEFLSRSTNIPVEYIQDKMEGHNFKTVRDLYQYIGTNVIREYNPDWHVEKIRDMINPFEDYVIDDVRFPNEKRLIESLWGECWYISRPKVDNIINHISETSLTWKDFKENIIINDKGLDFLEFKWDTFLKNYSENAAVRLGVLETLKAKDFNIEKVADPFHVFDMNIIPKDLFTYIEKKWEKENIKNVTIDDAKNAIIEFKDGTFEMVQNRLNIEDLKLLL